MIQAPTRRPFQQVQPARHRQHRAGRILVRGRGLDQARRLAPGILGDDQAVGVHAHRHHVQVAGMEGGLGASVAGFLQPGGVAGIGQQLHAQRQRALGALGDDHMRGVAAHPRETRRYWAMAARSWLAHRMAVAQRGGRRGLQRAVLRATPGVDGELVQRRRARRQRQGAVVGHAGGGDAAQPRGGEGRRLRRFGMAGGAGRGGRQGRHARALAVGHHIAFGRELLVGDQHRVA